MKLIKMPSIGQFRNIVRDVQHATTFIGLDENEKPIYDNSIKLPTIKFTGTVKLHGTNASICYNGKEMWSQSKKNVISIGNDNAGFAFFVESNKDYLEVKMSSLLNSIKNAEEVCLYGEWAGKGIQKGVGISELEKRFYMFSVKYKLVGEEDYKWIKDPQTLLSSIDNNNSIKSMYNFKTYEIDIDFNSPKLYQNKLIEITDKVEEECPVSSYYNVCGIGEGIVWVGWYNDTKFEFKVKGEKHSKSKVKTLSPIDEEKENNKREFANYACPFWRLEQMYYETFDIINGGTATIKGTGDFIRAVIKDVMKEDMDVMKERGLEPKEVNSYISKICKDWFMNKLNENI